jgi:hypothetical protein
MISNRNIVLDFCLAASLFLASITCPQGDSLVSRASNFTPTDLDKWSDFFWLSDTTLLLIRDLGSDESTSLYAVYDVTARNQKQVPGIGRAIRTAAKPDAAGPIGAFQVSPNGRFLLWTRAKQGWVAELDTGKVIRRWRVSDRCHIQWLGDSSGWAEFVADEEDDFESVNVWSLANNTAARRVSVPPSIPYFNVVSLQRGVMVGASRLMVAGGIGRGSMAGRVDHQEVLTFDFSGSRVTLSVKSTVPPPQEYLWNVLLSPSGQHVAWLFEKPVHPPPVGTIEKSHNLTGSSARKVWAVSVGSLKGNMVRELGTVSGDHEGAPIERLEWLPSGRSLSFYCMGRYYLLKAE